MKYSFTASLLIITSLCIGQVDTAQVKKNRALDNTTRLDFLLVDLNWDRLIGLKGASQKWYGRGISVNLMFDQPLDKQGRYAVAAGAGFTSHNYYTDALVEKVAGSQRADFVVQPTAIKDRGKISLNYVDVPIEFRFRTLEDKHGHRWKVGVGARAGYLINAHEKIINGQGRKSKLYHYPHLAKFRYGPTLRFGYGSLMLTGYYSLSTFFQEGKGATDMNAFSLGLTISPF